MAFEDTATLRSLLARLAFPELAEDARDDAFDFVVRHTQPALRPWLASACGDLLTSFMAGKAGIVDKGFQDYRAMLKQWAARYKPKIHVGIFDEDGAQPAGDEVTLLEVATWQEFGTSDGHVPARSFIRAFFDERTAECNEALARIMQAELTSPNGDLARGLEKFGLWIQGQIQSRIARGIAPANAESTVRAKGSSKPLVDTGQLRSSITFATELEGKIQKFPSKAEQLRKEGVKAKVRTSKEKVVKKTRGEISSGKKKRSKKG